MFSLCSISSPSPTIPEEKLRACRACWAAWSLLAAVSAGGKGGNTAVAGRGRLSLKLSAARRCALLLPLAAVGWHPTAALGHSRSAGWHTTVVLSPSVGCNGEDTESCCDNSVLEMLAAVWDGSRNLS